MKKNSGLFQSKSAPKIFFFSLLLVCSILALNYQSFAFADAQVTKPGFLMAVQQYAPVKVDNSNRKSSGTSCGSSDSDNNGKPVMVTIDIGCKGQGNPIIDAMFAIIRFLTLGAGLVMVGSIVVAGIQYTTSRGDPQATAKAMGRITSTLGALALLIFAYALLNWLVPGGAFN